ncbi:MAG: tail fiber domain-containing protein [Bacteroidota bacterium]
MKLQSTLTLFLVTLSLFVQAQNNGMGTTSPTHTLHIKPDPNNPNPDPIRLENLQEYEAEGDSTLLVVDPTTGVLRYMTISKVLSLVTPDEDPWYSVLSNTPATSNTEDMFTLGKIGIGTTSPTTELDIEGSMRLRIIPTGNETDEILTTDAEGNLRKRTVLEVVGPQEDFFLGNRDQNLQEDRSIFTKGFRLNIDTTTLTVDGESNRVGIGTNEPLAKLQITGSGSQTAGLLISNAADRARTWFPYTNGSNYITGDAQTGDGHTIFRVDNGTTYTEYMRLTNAGRLGIGTSNPRSVFQLRNNVGTDSAGLTSFRDFINYQVLLHQSGNNPQNSYGLGIEGSTLALNSNRDYDFNIRGADKMTLTPAGLAIGHRRPRANLDVIRGTGTWGTLALRGTNRVTHFHYNEDEHTYIRGGKSNSNVILNDNGGNVGIGTANPVGRLNVRGNVDNQRLVSFTSRENRHLHLLAPVGGVAPFVFYTNNGYDLQTDGISRLTIIDNGRVGINTNAPAQNLSVNGSAGKPGGGAWVTFSDARVKENIQPFTSGLAEVLQIQPKSFSYNGKGGYAKDGKTYYGIIAQDIQKIAPYMVEEIETEDFSDQLSYDGTALSYILVNAIKEQQAEIEAQQKQIQALQAQNKKLQKALDKMEGLAAEIETIKRCLAQEHSASVRN